MDRNALLEKEATELSNAFKVYSFKGYSLLKRQDRTRSKAVMPPESDFTNHYRAHYQPGTETPLEIHGSALPPSESDNHLSRDDFDTGIRSLNDNRQPGHDDCAPDYVKRGGPVFMRWLYVLMLRIWTFACELPIADRIGRIIPIPKKTNSTSVDLTRPICLLTTIYKLYAGILVFQCDEIHTLLRGSWCVRKVL